MGKIVRFFAFYLALALLFLMRFMLFVLAKFMLRGLRCLPRGQFAEFVLLMLCKFVPMILFVLFACGFVLCVRGSIPFACEFIPFASKFACGLVLFSCAKVPPLLFKFAPECALFVSKFACGVVLFAPKFALFCASFAPKFASFARVLFARFGFKFVPTFALGALHVNTSLALSKAKFALEFGAKSAFFKCVKSTLPFIKAASFAPRCSPF